MNVSRRFFIGGAFGALGALSGCRIFTGTCCDGTPKLRFGVVSDVHVRLSNDGKGLYEPNDCTTFIHTLEWFRDQGVDAVMIAGDIADHGMVGEMEAVAKAYQKKKHREMVAAGKVSDRRYGGDRNHHNAPGHHTD